MGILNKIAIQFFLVRLFLLGNSCLYEGSWTEEHDEMFEKVGISRKFSPTTITTATQMQSLIREERAPPAIPSIHDPMLPLAQFCHENMDIFCWAIFALLALSLVIYQLRSILWLKKEVGSKNRHIIQKDCALLPLKNGQQPNNQDPYDEPVDPLYIPRMLSQRSASKTREPSEKIDIDRKP